PPPGAAAPARPAPARTTAITPRNTAATASRANLRQHPAGRGGATASVAGWPARWSGRGTPDTLAHRPGQPPAGGGGGWLTTAPSPSARGVTVTSQGLVPSGAW